MKTFIYNSKNTELMGKITSGIFLSYLISEMKTEGKNKISRTDAQGRKETGLTEDQLRRVKIDMKKRNFIKLTLEGKPAKTWYEMDQTKRIEELRELK